MTQGFVPHQYPEDTTEIIIAGAVTGAIGGFFHGGITGAIKGAAEGAMLNYVICEMIRSPIVYTVD